MLDRKDFWKQETGSGLRRKCGQASLPVVLLISGVLIIIAVVGAVIAVALNNTVLNARMSAKALSAAETGANDAVTLIQRGCILSNTCPSSYTITIDSQTSAQVTIANNSGIVTVNSIGSAAGRESKIQAVLGVDSTTGLVNVRSFGEVPL
ncbi:MAG: hypothetical protein M1153_00745 [Patescibacteria group bacterium]|nr:hypothetical protein [Patescibacteria group bacterium]